MRIDGKRLCIRCEKVTGEVVCLESVLKMCRKQGVGNNSNFVLGEYRKTLVLIKSLEINDGAQRAFWKVRKRVRSRIRENWRIKNIQQWCKIEK